MAWRKGKVLNDNPFMLVKVFENVFFVTVEYVEKWLEVIGGLAVPS